MYQAQHFTGSIAVRTQVFDVGFASSLYFLNMSSESTNSYWEVYFDKDVNSLDQPVQPTLTAKNTGGTIPKSTPVYVRVTAVDGTAREALASAGLRYVTTESGGSVDDNSVIVEITAVPGAASYNVYAGTIAGGEDFVANTASLTYTITAVPANDRTALDHCSPDIFIYSKVAGLVPWVPPQGVISWTSSCKVFVQGGSGNTVANLYCAGP